MTPLAVTLNDVVVDAEVLLAAASPTHRSQLERVVAELKRHAAEVTADQRTRLERCQLSLYALIDAARLCCSGLDIDDRLRVNATACRRKAQATLFTVQWLLAQRVQQHA